LPTGLTRVLTAEPTALGHMTTFDILGWEVIHGCKAAWNISVIVYDIALLEETRYPVLKLQSRAASKRDVPPPSLSIWGIFLSLDFKIKVCTPNLGRIS
jgi:hypothetical protein